MNVSKARLSQLLKKTVTKSRKDCCIVKPTKKYLTRPGPPYPANDACCRNTIKAGNNGLLYYSRKTRGGFYVWKKIHLKD